MLYDYLDRRVSELDDDDIFVLSAVRTWVFAARNGFCVQARLRSGFTKRHIAETLLPFLCAMALLDRHGYGTMRFAEVCYPNLSDDEARVLNLFAAARIDNPRLIRIAVGLVSDDMAVQLADATAEVGRALCLRSS
ncbi:hypothetical protein [Sphingomonas gellani]|nr:hypothetical protein [Sphingomonas gellani]